MKTYKFKTVYKDTGDTEMNPGKTLVSAMRVALVEADERLVENKKEGCYEIRNTYDDRVMKAYPVDSFTPLKILKERLIENELWVVGV